MFRSRFLAIIIVTAGLAMPANAYAGYGAIAYSPDTGAMGWSFDYGSRYGAEQRALNGCYDHASDCRILVWVHNTCAALATGRNGGYGFAWHARRSVAQSRARAQCRRRDRGCRIKKWICG